LKALAGLSPGYWPEMDALRAALEAQTHDERIEAMARAIARRFAEATCNEDGGGETVNEYVDEYWPQFAADARAAWAAADVEGMVQKAVIAGINHGAAERSIDGKAVEAIVARVMGRVS
jgi:hypothetical protein